MRAIVVGSFDFSRYATLLASEPAGAIGNERLDQFRDSSVPKKVRL